MAMGLLVLWLELLLLLLNALLLLLLRLLYLEFLHLRCQVVDALLGFLQGNLALCNSSLGRTVDAKERNTSS